MTIDPQLLKQVLECAILAAGEPVDIARFQQLFDEGSQPTDAEIKSALETLGTELDTRGLTLKEVASGFTIQIKPELQSLISKLWDTRPPRYSRALLETLALIAYRQPITRAEIEEIRGVSIASTTFKILTDREWIRVVGHRDVPGKPGLYATTKQFLDYFNLKNLDELPPLAEIIEMANIKSMPEPIENKDSSEDITAHIPQIQTPFEPEAAPIEQ